jgi:integrase
MLTDAKVAAIKPPASGQEEHRDNKVTGLRLRVGAGGKKTWIMRRRVGSKVLNRKLGSYPGMGLATARKAAEKLLEALEREGSGAVIDRTFGDVADAWLAMKEQANRRNRGLELQRRRLDLHVLPKWRDRRLIEIRRSDVRDLIGGIEGAALPNAVLALIRPIFRYALSRDWIEASPAEGITRPNQETERDRFLDMGDVKRVWDASALLGYPSTQFVRALLLTGQRRTEVASMRWADLDLDVGTWLLTSSDTKADRAHLVPLAPAVVELLRQCPRLGPFVFTSDGETHISGYAKTKARLDSYLGAAGEQLEPWRFHDLRRTVGTHLARLGISKDIRARVLNHAMQGVTDRTYNVFDYAAEKRGALERWAGEVMRVVEDRAADNVVALKGGA